MDWIVLPETFCEGRCFCFTGSYFRRTGDEEDTYTKQTCIMVSAIRYNYTYSDLHFLARRSYGEGGRPISALFWRIASETANT